MLYYLFPCLCPADLILWSYLWGVCWGGFMQSHKNSGKKILGPEVFNLLNIQDTAEESKEWWGSCFYTLLLCIFVCLLYTCSVLWGLQQPTLSHKTDCCPQACMAHGDLQRVRKNISTSTPSSNLQGNLTELFTLAKNNKESGGGKQQTNTLVHGNGLWRSSGYHQPELESCFCSSLLSFELLLSFLLAVVVVLWPRSWSTPNCCTFRSNESLGTNMRFWELETVLAMSWLASILRSVMKAGLFSMASPSSSVLFASPSTQLLLWEMENQEMSSDIFGWSGLCSFCLEKSSKACCSTRKHRCKHSSRFLSDACASNAHMFFKSNCWREVLNSKENYALCWRKEKRGRSRQGGGPVLKWLHCASPALPSPPKT